MEEGNEHEEQGVGVELGCFLWENLITTHMVFQIVSKFMESDIKLSIGSYEFTVHNPQYIVEYDLNV